MEADGTPRRRVFRVSGKVVSLEWNHFGTGRATLFAGEVARPNYSPKAYHCEQKLQRQPNEWSWIHECGESQFF